MHGEIKGALIIPLGAEQFILTAQADRIERANDGTYIILDYKTGAPPTSAQVRSGMAPQLTLEGAILRGGGFAELGVGSLAKACYVRLRGGEKGGELEEIDFKKASADSYADEAREKLTKIAFEFLVNGKPYDSLVHPMWTKYYGDYDHLARVKEWAASGGESEVDFGQPS